MMKKEREGRKKKQKEKNKEGEVIFLIQKVEPTVQLFLLSNIFTDATQLIPDKHPVPWEFF